MQRKGIVTYLLITFALTYAIEGMLILSGFRLTETPPMYGQIAIAAVMWIPTLATILTMRFVTHEPRHSLNLRFGSLRPYLITMLVIPVCFAVIYGLTWLVGLGQPDWQLTHFLSLLRTTDADLSTMPQPTVLLLLMLLTTSLFTPFINGIFGLGEEIGWRGYLLPRLMPLGKTKAYLSLGVIWGLWHAPLILIGFNYPGYPLLGIVGMMGLTTALGIYLNELTLRHQSTFLAGWIHGLFNSQGYGIWRILFPTVNPILGGLTGLIGIGVWLAVGLWEIWRGQTTMLKQHKHVTA